MKRTCFLLVFCFISINLFSQSDLLINVYNRNTTLLNGDWKYIIDPYENGYYNYRYEPFDKQKNPSRSAFFTNSKPKTPSDLIEYDFNKMDNIKVPGDWNTQKPELLYYEGTIWYKKSFDYLLKKNSNRLFLYFGACNYKTEVYLNGNKLGIHIGGFTPFNFEITDIVKEKDNFLIVKVDNKRHKEGVPTLNTDWWNYGGITRDVKLIETPETFVKDYFIQLNPNNNREILGFIKLDGKIVTQQKIIFSIEKLNINEKFVTDNNGVVDIKFISNKINYWSNDNPFLYKVKIISNEDTLIDQIGFRTIRTKGSKIILNDNPIFLKGISIHEESPITGGRANSIQDAEQLLNWAEELGCNYVRLAHYPHNENMVRLADRKGILIWEENPVYWTIDWKNPETYNNAENQLSEMISRDKNRASVIIWSMANETPKLKERTLFLTKLAAHTKSKDPTRLISAALEQKNYINNPKIRTIDDPFAKYVNVLSFNEYIGWYDGLPSKCDSITWSISQNKPVIISEFGAGAKQGFHGSKSTRWTEEFQEVLYKKTLKMIDKIDQLSGLSPWILVDFRSPRRVLPDIQNGFNRKGLISDKGEKKKAFFILQQYYRPK